MAIPESRRMKLQMLLQSPGGGRIAEANALLRASVPPAGRARAARAGPLPLAKACPGRQRTVTADGKKLKYYLVRRSLGQVAPDKLDVQRQYRAVMRGARQRFDELEASAALCHVADLAPEDLLFMDTETCGLAGAAVFLVGLMFHDGRELIFEQYLARNYAEEAGVLRAFARRLAAAGALVSFNGKAFDMTILRERSAFHGVPLPRAEPPHLDLLHESRRRWKHVVPNCRLTTLERLLCGRARIGDIAGAEIPDAYHDFVRTADAARMKDVLHHNLLDLLTLAELLCAILTGCDPLDR